MTTNRATESLDCLLTCPLFVFPDGFYVKQRTLDPPLGLMALAGYVRASGLGVELFDLNYHNAATNEQIEAVFVERYVKRFHEIKVIGFTTTTTTIYAAFRAAEIFRKYYPKATIVFGGAHASFVPDESLDKDFIDAVCIGEGEETLVEVIRGKPFAEVDGLAWKRVANGEVEFVKNKPRTRLKKLDDLPLPAYDLLDIGAYRPILGNFKRLPAMMLVSSRGCPWPCNFCRRPVGRMWTYRSAQSLYDEFRHLSETYGIKDIAIMDDVFTVNEKRVDEFCDLLIEKPLDIKWKCFARVDIVNPEMLKKMQRAGCWGIMYGVENFNQTVLDGMAKGIEISQVYDAVRWSKEADLEVRVCMMVGNVGDTEEIINRNIDLLIDLDPDYIALAILTPFPGHDIYNWAIERDLITTFNWDDYYGSTPILKLDTLTPEQITHLFRKMAFRFYFRPGFIWKKLKRLRSFEELRLNATGFFGLFSFALERFVKGLTFRSESSERVAQPIHGTGPVKIDKEKVLRLTRTATKQTAIT
jgi:radical SAM superfamily enzyme YgiQ (UPF0313 family)